MVLFFQCFSHYLYVYLIELRVVRGAIPSSPVLLLELFYLLVDRFGEEGSHLGGLVPEARSLRAHIFFLIAETNANTFFEVGNSNKDERSRIVE